MSRKRPKPKRNPQQALQTPQAGQGGQGGTTSSEPSSGLPVRTELQLVQRALDKRWGVPAQTKDRLVQRMHELLNHHSDRAALGAAKILATLEAQDQKDEFVAKHVPLADTGRPLDAKDWLEAFARTLPLQDQDEQPDPA